MNGQNGAQCRALYKEQTWKKLFLLETKVSQKTTTTTRNITIHNSPQFTIQSSMHENICGRVICNAKQAREGLIDSFYCSSLQKKDTPVCTLT